MSELDINSTTEGLGALRRLLAIAERDTGQSRMVADFLLSWHNAAENGGWNPVDLWAVDEAIAADILAVLKMVRYTRRYPDNLGFNAEIFRVWDLWRGVARSRKP